MDYPTLIALLEKNSDPKLQKFNQKLKSQVHQDYGVKIPILRSIAKRIIKEDPDSFLQWIQDNSQEEIILQGMVIALSDFPFEKKLALTEKHLNKVCNWACCDIFCGDFKPSKNELMKLHQFILPYLKSEDEFKCRFAIVMLMSYYIQENNIDSTLSYITQVTHEGYYVKMAIAWALSKIYVHYPQKVKMILINGKLDTFTHNKSIQKMIESYRISEEDKKILKKLKKQ